MYGFPVTMPMEIPPEVIRSAFAPPIPGLAELPEIIDARTNGLRLQHTAAKALPPMVNAGSGTNVRQLEAIELMNNLRAASSVMKPQARRSQAIARAKNRRMEQLTKKFGVR